MAIKAATRRGGDIDIGNVSLKKETHWYPRPNLDKENARKLHEISHHLDFRWNPMVGYWEVWFDNKMNQPYIVARVVEDHTSSYRPIDNRVFIELRKAFWESRRRWVEREAEMLRAMSYAKDRREAQAYDDHYQMGKEIAPMMKTLVDAGGSSHGRSKWRWQGADLH